MNSNMSRTKINFKNKIKIKKSSKLRKPCKIELKPNKS